MRIPLISLQPGSSRNSSKSPRKVTLLPSKKTSFQSDGSPALRLKKGLAKNQLLREKIVRLLRKLDFFNISLSTFTQLSLFPQESFTYGDLTRQFLRAVKRDDQMETGRLLAVNPYLVYDFDAVTSVSAGRSNSVDLGSQEATTRHDGLPADGQIRPRQSRPFQQDSLVHLSDQRRLCHRQGSLTTT